MPYVPVPGTPWIGSAGSPPSLRRWPSKAENFRPIRCPNHPSPQFARHIAIPATPTRCPHRRTKKNLSRGTKKKIISERLFWWFSLLLYYYYFLILLILCVYFYFAYVFIKKRIFVLLLLLLIVNIYINFFWDFGIYEWGFFF